MKKEVPEFLPAAGLESLIAVTSESDINRTELTILESKSEAIKQKAKKSSRTKNNNCPSGENSIKSSFYFPEDVFVSAKIYCAKSRMTMTALVVQSVKEYMKKHSLEE